MGQRIYKIITDKGILYAVFDKVLDQFVTPPAASVSALEHDAEEASEEGILDLTSKTLNKVDAAIAKLEAGKNLNKGEVATLYSFNKFLEGTVAEHQYTYPEIDPKKIEGWISELNLKEQFIAQGDENVRNFIHDKALYPSYQQRALNPKRPLKELDKASPSQKKLAGRYLRALVTIGNILGPKKSTIKQVLTKFFKKLEGTDN